MECTGRRACRLIRELKYFEENPPHGISCWMKDGSNDQLVGQIVGGDETPYRGGVFKLEITVPDRYPFEAPKICFITPVYHPNVDSMGRICLDLLKMPPGGSWKPVFNIGTVLSAIQLLLAEPNPDDPLMADVAWEFKFSRQQFEQKAMLWTKKYATDGTVDEEEMVVIANEENTKMPLG